jgi:chromosome segregation ATPase
MSDQEPEKNNLINFIAVTVESMRDQMSEMRGQIIDITDQMATKSDLAQLESRLTAKLEAETIAIRGDIEQVHLRLDSIDRTLRARLDQIETEMSRLRSVLYLLVKDRPEMLRLLGQTPPASDEGRP